MTSNEQFTSAIQQAASVLFPPRGTSVEHHQTPGQDHFSTDEAVTPETMET